MARAEEELRSAELAILNAPFAERGWERAVAAIARATGSAAAQLIGVGGPLTLPLNVYHGDTHGHDAYLADLALHGACNWRVGSGTTELAIQHEADYAAYRAQHATADYDDACSDLDIPFGCQSALVLSDGGLIGLALLRGQNEGPCDAATLRSFARLRFKAARAVRAQIALDGQAADLMIGDLSARDCATLLLDRHGWLCTMTAGAQQLAEAGGPLTARGGVVCLRAAEDDDRFQRALRWLLALDGAEGANAVAQVRTSWWRVTMVRLPADGDRLGFQPHIAVTLTAA